MTYEKKLKVKPWCGYFAIWENQFRYWMTEPLNIFTTYDEARKWADEQGIEE